MFKAVIAGLISFLMSALVARSQVVEPVRIELPAKIDQPAYYVEAVGESGLLVYYISTETEEGRRRWYFSLLDTNLREKWLQYVLLTDGVVFLDSHTDHSQVVLFLGQNEGKRQSQNVYELIRIDLNTGVIVKFTGLLPDRADLSKLAAIGQDVLLGLNLPGYKADLLRFNMADGSMQSLPLSDGGQAWIQEIKANPKGPTFFIALRKFERNRLIEDHFVEIDRQGTELKKWSFIDEDHFLLSVSMIPEADGLVVCGTFDSDRRRISAREITNMNQTGEAKGYYFLRFHRDEPYNASFWRFDNFTSLVRNLPPDMVLSSIRSRNYRYRTTEPDLRITLQFSAGRILKSGNKYIFTAEAYRPLYRLETRMDYDFYGRLVPYTYSIFEGYQVFAGLSAAFNEVGNLDWSTSLELRQATLPAVRSMVSVSEDSGTFVMASLQQSVLTSKITSFDGQQLGQPEQTRIEPVFAADRVLEERYGSIMRWYGKYYIASGYQRISNNMLRGSNPRSVFFLQKLALE